jgi:hypothetical protein
MTTLHSNLVQKIRKHHGCSFNDIRTLRHSSRIQPSAPFFRVIQVASDEDIAFTTPKFLFESIPELIGSCISVFLSILILSLGSPHLHSDRHEGPCKCSTQRPFPANPRAKSCCHSRQERILNFKILLETQGDRFGSVETLLKISPGLL